MKLVDRIHQRYGRLVVVGRGPNYNYKTNRSARWICRCDCGKETLATGRDLSRGKVKSCGCWNNDRIAELGHGNKTHGMSDTRIYRIWTGMLNRCCNPNSSKWRLYGRRGIKVCESWMKFENFISDMGIPEDTLSLDRIDQNGNYCKENCRWATSKEQGSNKRNNVRLNHNGMTLTVAEWARVLGISSSAMQCRIYSNFPPDKMFLRKMK